MTMAEAHTWPEYLAWWKKDGPHPRLPEYRIRAYYDRYLMRKREELAKLTRGDTDQRHHEYEFQERQVGKTARHIHHLDGNPHNNSKPNLIEMAMNARSSSDIILLEESSMLMHYSIGDVELTNEIHSATNGGYTYQEAIQMKACILKVVYSGGTVDKEYEFLAPFGTVINPDAQNYFAVPHTTVDGVIKAHNQVVVVNATQVIDIIDGEYNGKLKWIIGPIDTKPYNDRVEREAKRAKIIKQLEAVAEKKNTVEKLKKLTEGDPEAAKLFDLLNALDAE
jgi:hypothetical protein